MNDTLEYHRRRISDLEREMCEIDAEPKTTAWEIYDAGLRMARICFEIAATKKHIQSEHTLDTAPNLV